MKNYLSLITLLLFAACTTGDTEHESTQLEEVENIASETLSRYGAEIDTNGAISPKDLLVLMETEDSAHVKLSTTILETCSKKGCWMNVGMEDGEEMMVRFKDYGFFVPKAGVVNKSTIFEGQAYYDTLSVEELRHYALDAGKDSSEIMNINESKPILAFEATGVIIID